ncbi:phage terminase small subunit [Clostridium amylolyticum]|uniref:Phage terminase small subunit n=1 Tax=Clostridium amylolyticum TaxID=1121298 RepID=A0A1M6EYI0_9CLOT|nr:terminase small subunit [Clostridium amylolyticum]SHI90513.1 phage terminase small subunit [Clostridium amylolyticum]
MAKLTPKQKIFVDEYLVDLNATRAYKVAYPSCKKEETINAAASRMLRNVKVKDYIDKRMKDREKRTEIKQDDVIREIASIANDDIKNYLSFKTEKVFVGYDVNGLPVQDYRTIVNMKDSDEIDTKNISEISIGKDGQFKFKLYCRDNALIQLGKHLGMFKDKVEVTGNMKVNNPYEGLTTEQLLRLAQLSDDDG